MGNFMAIEIKVTHGKRHSGIVSSEKKQAIYKVNLMLK